MQIDTAQPLTLAGEEVDDLSVIKMDHDPSHTFDPISDIQR